MSARARLGRVLNNDGMRGGTACKASLWLSDSGTLCKIAGGVGGSSRQGWGLPVVISASLQQASLTQAWSYDAAVRVSSVGVGTNGPSSGSTSATVAGVSFGSAGYSGGARVGRGAASSVDMTGGTVCSASTWMSSSSVFCRLAKGRAPFHFEWGLPVVVTVGLQQGSLTQAWSYDGAAVSAAGNSRDRKSVV